MNSTGVLDDYLDELLGEAIVAAPAAAPPAPRQPEHRHRTRADLG
jgi:purine-binding chemotaxis protein CheW